MSFCLLLFSVLGLLGASFLHAAVPAQEVLREINAVRTANGLAVLSWDVDAGSLAQAWADRLAQERRLRHRTTDNLKAALQKSGWRAINENLHRATAPTDAKSVVRSWMASPAHRGNLLQRTVTKGGVGWARGDDGQDYVVFNGAG